MTTILSHFVPKAHVIISKGLFCRSSRDFHVPLAHVRCLPTALRPVTDTYTLGQILFLAITMSVRRNPTELTRGSARAKCCLLQED